MRRPVLDCDGVGRVHIRHSTIAFNRASGVGGGVFLVAGPLALDHTILASNDTASAPDVTAMGCSVHGRRPVQLDRSERGQRPGEAPVGFARCERESDRRSGERTVINPLLGPLLDNGGLTQDARAWPAARPRRRRPRRGRRRRHRARVRPRGSRARLQRVLRRPDRHRRLRAAIGADTEFDRRHARR